MLLALTFWGVVAWCVVRVAFGAPVERRCRPLIISGTPCGKLCRTPTGVAIRGCKPLNQLVRT
jgi:hypothetical protein